MNLGPTGLFARLPDGETPRELVGEGTGLQMGLLKGEIG
jgi:hypothetical protein